MVRKYIYLGLGAMLALAGCAGPRGTGMSVTRPLGRGIQSFNASSGDMAQPVSADTGEPQDTVTLHHALALALMRNPELASESWSVRAAEARIIQAKAFQNPEVGVEVEDFGGGGEASGFDAAKMSIVLSQVVELGGRRSRRRDAATLELELASWEYEVRRLEVLTETTVQFIDVLAAQRAYAIAQSGLSIASNVHHAVSERVRAGKDSPLDRIKSQGELASSRLIVMQAARDLKTSRHSLAAMWGSDRISFEEVHGSWPEMSPDIPLYKDFALRLNQNPDMERVRLELRLAETGLAAAKAARIPNLEVSAGIEQSQAEDGQTFIAGVGLEIPLFDRNSGGIREARAAVEMARQNEKATGIALQTALRAAYETLVYAKDAATTIANDVLPAAQEAFSAAEEGYRAGKFDYLDVLDAQRTLSEAESSHLEFRAEYHKSVAQMERLAGEELATIKTETGDTQ